MKSSVNIQYTFSPASEDIDFLTHKIPEIFISVLRQLNTKLVLVIGKQIRRLELNIKVKSFNLEN